MNAYQSCIASYDGIIVVEGSSVLRTERRRSRNGENLESISGPEQGSGISARVFLSDVPA